MSFGRGDSVSDIESDGGLNGSGVYRIPSSPTILSKLPYDYPTSSSAETFLRLPPEVIHRILTAVDSNGFASISLINRTWYELAQKVELYAYHLSRCPSYALCNNVITGPFRKNDLYRLKTKFAAEVRRNLFEAYMRPRQTLVNLISINANSSAAFPGGEVFRFSFSPNGQTLLALSSSRVYVLDATSDVITVRKELKTLRRPLAASITDDGSLLAVLSSKHQANIYALTSTGTKHLQVLVLDNPPRTIALAHEGTVLAAAYEGGVEVFSLSVNALSTDRRAVRSEAMDTLQFSGDGSMLVGSSQSLEDPNAVVINAPFYTENDPDLSSREIHSRMWTTQILFPQISSITSHAELLQGHNEGDANWLFAYDHSLTAFRAVRTDDTRTGVAYFLNPATAERFEVPSPSIAPTATACGTLVAAGFAESGLWVYGVPERLDLSPDMGSVVERHEQKMRGPAALTTATGHIEPLMAYSPSLSAAGNVDEYEGDSLAAKVDWRQSLFIKCRNLESLDGCSAAKWVEQPEHRISGFYGKRLVVVAPGGVNAFGEDLGDENMPVDGSRICLLDFDYGPSTGLDREITIEVGDDPPELLTEYSGEIDAEVAMERRRTVRGPRNGRATARTTLTRSATAATHSSSGDYFDQERRIGSASQPSSPTEGAKSPPSRPPPVSALSLQRSATSGGFRTALYPPRPPLGSEQPSNTAHVVYNRPAGRRDSHESWETPPPPYSSGGPRSSPRVSPFHQPNSPGWADHQGGRQNANTQGGGPNLNVPGGGPGYPAGQQAGGMLSPRSRTDGHLATVSESAIPQQTFPNGHVQYNNVPAAFAPRSSAVPARAPMAEFVQHGEDGFNPRASLTHPLLPPNPEQNEQLRLPSPLLEPVRTSSAGSITLTGANLQNRLNHPVPPTPNTQPGVHNIASANPSQQHTAQHVINDGYGFAPPTQDQMSNLHRRVSQTQLQPLSVVTNGNHATGSGSRDYGVVPPSPPRAAWGATGVPGSPNFNKARNSPNGYSRPASTASNAPMNMSSSTPNLGASQQQRPKYGRMDTIDSVEGSQQDHDGAGRMHGQSALHDLPTPVMEFSPDGGDPRRIGPDAWPDVGKKKKAKKRKEEGSQYGGSAGGKEKKGSKCTVM